MLLKMENYGYKQYWFCLQTTKTTVAFFFFLLVKSSSYVFEHCAFHGIALLGKRWIGEQQNCTLASWQVSINDKTKLQIGIWPSAFRVLDFSQVSFVSNGFFQLSSHDLILAYVGYFLLSFPWVMLKIILWIICLC